MQEILASENSFTGSLPEALRTLQTLGVLAAATNKLQGSIQGSSSALQLVSLGMNLLRGALPKGLGEAGAVQGLQRLEASCNLIAGALPRSLHGLVLLRALEVSSNQLTGSLPEGLIRLSTLVFLVAAQNSLAAQIPSSIGAMMQLRFIVCGCNRFRGALPGILGLLPQLVVLSFDDNPLRSTIPATLCSLTALQILGLARTELEGTLPRSLPQLSRLRYFSYSSELHRRKIRGTLPPCLANAMHLQCLLGAYQHLEGSIPAFSSTFAVLALQENALQSLSRLRMHPSAAILLHRNRLSCRLSADSLSHAAASLVAMGNHLIWSGHQVLPSWVLPYERDSLFWCHSDAGSWLLLKTLAGFSGLLLAWMLQLGCRRCIVSIEKWHGASGVHGLTADLTQQFFFFMLSQWLGSTILLLLVIRCSYLVCPTILSLASACLLESFWVRLLVVIIWGRFYAESHQAQWTGYIQGNIATQEIVEWRHLRRGQVLFLWAVWAVIVSLVSGIVGVNVATKYTSSFLQIRQHYLAKHLDLGIGLFQGCSEHLYGFSNVLFVIWLWGGVWKGVGRG